MYVILPLFVSGLAFVSYIVIVAVDKFSLGFVMERALAPATAVHVVSGVFWGVGLGCMILKCPQFAQGNGLWIGRYILVSLGVAIAIGISIAFSHSQFIPNLRLFAKDWDDRHLEIIRQRAGGSETIAVPELTYNLGDRYHGFHLFDDTYNYCPKIFYGVESITRSSRSP